MADEKAMDRLFEIETLLDAMGIKFDTDMD
jgi:hypothetical protein